jgi:predicted nucleic acid-binding protein
MSDIILLDSGPLGLVTNPTASHENRECNLWIQSQLQQNIRVLVPAIADYEVRRELLRAGKTSGVARLDDLKRIIGYAPLTTEALLQAAALWAEVRQMGRPTAPDLALDGDVILCAQAAVLASEGHQVVLATTNVKHLKLFADARLWRDII